jgi:hypothetical protein
MRLRIALTVLALGFNAAIAAAQTGVELVAQHRHLSVPELRIRNTHSVDVAIQVKVWLQVPNGTRHAAWDFGSDGSIVFPFFHSRNLAPFDLFEVTEAVERGEYELGCRLLDPTTGRQLHEAIAVFRVR